MKSYAQTASSTDGFTRREAAIIAASRTISDHDTVFVGQGLPVISAMFAKRIHAKECVIMNEYGVVDTDPPIAVELASPIFARNATFLCDMLDSLGCFIYHADVALLGAAQIDRYGNVNTTVIGDYFEPKLRISGSGGGNDIGSLAPKVILVMDNQRADRFPASIDYNTTPNFFNGEKGERERLGLPGNGIEMVVTDLGIYKFSKSSREMYLESVQSGVTTDEVKLNTGWKLKTAREVGSIAAPTRDEIEILRSLDPNHVYLR